MELQKVSAALEETGIALFAVSYDAVDVLQGFAGRYGITYPLLSDEGSGVMRSLGILNEDAPPPVAGIPHPGVFVLDEDGRVAQKVFYPSYRERDTGAGLLEHALGIAAPTHGPAAQSAAEAVQVRAWLDRDTYAWGQRLWLSVDLEIAPGHHVYAPPTPGGYHPLTVTIDPIERVVFGAPRMPSGQPFRMEAFDEDFLVYEGTVRVELPISFMVVDAGTLTLNIHVGLQACTDSVCLLPATVDLALSADEVPLIERPQRPG